MSERWTREDRERFEYNLLKEYYDNLPKSEQKKRVVLTKNEKRPTAERESRLKPLFVGTIAIVIAVIISWYAAALILYDVDTHYPNGNTSVRITSTGEKYHLESCSYLHSSSIEITIEEASARGYGICSRCDPPRYISQEDYLQAKEDQPIVLYLVLIPLISVPMTLLCIMVIGPVYSFLRLFDIVADWFAVLLMCAIYITILIQSLQILIIW